MFKIAKVENPASFLEAKRICERIVQERPDYWPHGLDPLGFDGGLYLVREKAASTPVGIVGWQERWEMEGNDQLKTGYYAIGILPEYRRNGFAKQAVSKIIAMKSAGVDRVRAYIMAHNQPSLALADKLGVPANVKCAHWLPSLRPRKQDHPASRAVAGAGAAAGALGAGGVMASGLGKAAPSFVDMAHQMFTGPSGGELFDQLSKISPQDAIVLRQWALKSPARFKLALMGIKVPGISDLGRWALKDLAYQGHHHVGQVGDVLVNGMRHEIQPLAGRAQHAIGGSPLYHTFLNPPPGVDGDKLLADDRQGLKLWGGSLSNQVGANAVLRPKAPLNAEALRRGVEEGIQQPYDIGRLQRLTAHEVLSTPWSNRAKPTLMEHALNVVNKYPRIRKHFSQIPGMRERFAVNRMSNGILGDVCSTATARALQRSGKVFNGRNPSGIAPADFLRGVGKDFDVAALKLPSQLMSREELVANHLLKAGPMASRLAVAAPLLAGAGYLGHRALANRQR